MTRTPATTAPRISGEERVFRARKTDLHSQMDAPSIPIRHADRTGAVVREAIERIGGDRSQIGGASGHSHSDRRDRIIAAALVTVRVMTVGGTPDRRILSRPSPREIPNSAQAGVGAGSLSDGAAALDSRRRARSSDALAGSRLASGRAPKRSPRAQRKAQITRPERPRRTRWPKCEGRCRSS